MALRIVSADSHMIEPANLWLDRIDNRFKDRAPRAVTKPDKPGAFFMAEGLRAFPVAAFGATGRDGEEYAKHMATGYEGVRPSGWDPVERLKDQDIDGVESEVLYTSLGMPLFGLKDPDLQRACFRVYNDWLAEFCSHSPQRLLGIPLISLDDIGLAVKELERCRKQDLKGAMIWGSAPDDRPYSSPTYDPFWQAAAELDMPLSLHVVTGGTKSPVWQMVGHIAKSEKDTPGISQIGTYHFLLADIQVTLYTLVVSGVLERFPKLKFVSAENDTGWLPHFMYRLDHGYNKYWANAGIRKLQMTPSDYIRRQVYATFQDDPIGPATWSFFGEDNYMWASDFPHGDCTWPNSRNVIATDFSGVPEKVTSKIVFDNAVKLYGLHLN
jgi:predicted TIM-barrel fold metal-dependent hydrolase